MSTSRVVIVLACLALGVGSLTLLRGQEDRGVRLVPAVVDLGRVASGSVVEQDYVLCNDTDHRIHLRDLYRSCGCQELWIEGEEVAAGERAVERMVEPGEELALRMRFEVPGQVRRFDLRWTGVERTEQGDQPVELISRIHVLGFRPFWLEDEQRDLGSVRWNEFRDLEWDIGSDDGGAFSWDRVVATDGLVEVRTGEGGDSSTVRARFVPHRWGPQVETLRLERADGRSVLATVRAVVPEPFQLTQRYVGVGEVHRSTRLERTLDLPLREGFEPPRDVRIEAGSDRTRWEASWENGRLLCTLDAGDESGPCTAWLVFEWGEGCPPFRLPVHGYVR